MTTKQFYKKEGRRYVPVSAYDNDLCSSFPIGTSIVVVDKNLTMYKRNVDDVRAPVVGALMLYTQTLVDTLVEASRASPGSSARQKLTPEAAADWQAFIAKHGEEFRYLTYPSASGIAEASVQAFEQKVAALMKHPTVKDAYEKLLLTIKLTVSEEQNEST